MSTKVSHTITISPGKVETRVTAREASHRADTDYIGVITITHQRDPLGRDILSTVSGLVYLRDRYADDDDAATLARWVERPTRHNTSIEAEAATLSLIARLSEPGWMDALDRSDRPATIFAALDEAAAERESDDDA